MRFRRIGEAAAKVSAVGRDRMPGVPWALVVGMRNRRVHGYDEIDFDVVWKVATEEAPELMIVLAAAFATWLLPEPPGIGRRGRRGVVREQALRPAPTGTAGARLGG